MAAEIFTSTVAFMAWYLVSRNALFYNPVSVRIDRGVVTVQAPLKLRYRVERLF